MPPTPSRAAAPRPSEGRSAPQSSPRDPRALRLHLKDAGVTINREGYIPCPVHTERTPSCCVYDGPEGGHLHCYGCGFHADAYTYLTEHGGMDARAALELLDGPNGAPARRRSRAAPPPAPRELVNTCPTDPLPASVIEAHERRAAQLKRLPAALDGRGFTLEDVRRLRIANENDRAIIPVTGPDGRVLRLKVRKAPDEPGARYAYTDAHGTGTPAWCSPNMGTAPTVLVIEGELNGMAAWCARPELGVVGVAGTSGSLPLPALADRTVMLYADGDQPGRDARDRWADALRRQRCRVSTLAPWADGDACDIAGTLGRPELAARLHESRTAPDVDGPPELPDDLPPDPNDAPILTITANANTSVTPRKAPPFKLEPYRASDLQREQLPPTRWVVEGLIGVGLTVLAGPPKVGKSWLTLALVYAIAAGGRVLDKYQVPRAGALYLALEDNKKRIKSRLGKLTQDAEEWPDGLELLHAVPKLDDGLIEALEAWLDEHPACRVIVVDTLARIRGARSRNDDAYTNDSRVMEGLQALAMRRDLAVVIVHHVRKQPGGDVFETVSGTYGLTGPVDTIMVLERIRGEADAKLHVTGRDVMEQQLALNFNPDTAHWTIAGEARIYAQTPERRQLLEAIERNPGSTPKRLTDITGLNYDAVRQLLTRMTREEAVVNDGRGHYNPISGVTGVTGVTDTPQNTSRTIADSVTLPYPPRHSRHSSDDSDTVTLNRLSDASSELDTLLRLLTAVKQGQVTNPDIANEVKAINERWPGTEDDRARVLELATAAGV